MFIKQNKNAMLCGKVAKEPEKKVIDKGEKTYQIVNVSVVVGKDENDNSIWKNLYAWGSTLRNLKQGDVIFVCGEIEESKYTGRDGAEHTAEKIKVDFVAVQGKSSASEQTQAMANAQSLEPTETDGDNLPW